MVSRPLEMYNSIEQMIRLNSPWLLDIRIELVIRILIDPGRVSFLKSVEMMHHSSPQRLVIAF